MFRHTQVNFETRGVEPAYALIYVLKIMISKSGAINLENRKLDFTDEINGRLILTALTLCTGQWGNNYEEKNWLYFGTRRCSTIRIPTAQNPKKTNEKFEF